jgi:hypothetical protein
MSNYPWYDEARKELGIREGRDDAEILKLFREAGHPEIDGSDTAWCAAFAGAMLQRAGYKPSGSLHRRPVARIAAFIRRPRRFREQLRRRHGCACWRQSRIVGRRKYRMLPKIQGAMLPLAGRWRAPGRWWR